MSWNNVKQVQVTSITAVLASTNAPTGKNFRVMGYTILTSGTGGGHVEFKNGETTAGTPFIIEQVPTATNAWLFVKIPDGGVRFTDGCFVSAAAGITLGVLYG